MPEIHEGSTRVYLPGAVNARAFVCLFATKLSLSHLCLHSPNMLNISHFSLRWNHFLGLSSVLSGVNRILFMSFQDKSHNKGLY